MWLCEKGKRSIELEDDVVKQILNAYPEEELITRPVFQTAFDRGEIEYSQLKEECEKILIPWQMFLLDKTNFAKQVKNIETNREHKISAKLLSKRKGQGNVTSRRIIDRLIRQQNFTTSYVSLPTNSFCDSLKGLSIDAAAAEILSFFEIDTDKLRSYVTKGNALEYIIKQVEQKNINISRGVLSHKILPATKVVPSNVYRNTSGFAIKDLKLPCIFLPGEINPDEVESRQIYTLIFLLAIIGLGEYEYYLEPDFKTTLVNTSGTKKKLHLITTELLLPKSVTDSLLGTHISTQIRDSLSSKYKISPTALVTILRMRKVIDKDTYNILLPPPFVQQKGIKKHLNAPKISTSVKKFCGQATFDAINSAFTGGYLSSMQAQYLIFGAPNKKNFRKYRDDMKI